MKLSRLLVAVLVLVLATSRSLALEYEDDDVYVRVVDVGAGLCCVVKMPGDRFMVYYAGNYLDGGAIAFVVTYARIHQSSNSLTAPVLRATPSRPDGYG